MTRRRHMTMAALGGATLALGLATGTTAGGDGGGNCGVWVSIGTGMEESVFALTVYEGDLIAGGEFITADGLPASKVARWDGGSWQQVGEGLGFPGTVSQVNALEVHDGDLIAVGAALSYLEEADALAAFARWDGESWQFIGEQGCDTWIAYDVTVYEGDLIVAGDGGSCEHPENGLAEPQSHVLRWDGEHWWQVGDTDGFTSVHALAVFEGHLVAADVTGVIRRWDGTSWQVMGEMNDQVQALAVYDGALIAGGHFTLADGQPVNRIARWAGKSWLPMGGGMDDDVEMIEVVNGELFVGGRFETASGKPLNHPLVRWNGSSWMQFDEPGSVGLAVFPRIDAIAAYGPDLIVGGLDNGPLPHENIKRFVSCIDEITGGCCVGEGCIQVTSGECAAVGGTYLGDFADCEDACAPSCPADIAGEPGVVNVEDLLELLSSWGFCN